MLSNVSSVVDGQREAWFSDDVPILETFRQYVNVLNFDLCSANWYENTYTWLIWQLWLGDLLMNYEWSLSTN